jgi:hypothetical protein
MLKSQNRNFSSENNDKSFSDDLQVNEAPLFSNKKGKRPFLGGEKAPKSFLGNYKENNSPKRFSKRKPEDQGQRDLVEASEFMQEEMRLQGPSRDLAMAHMQLDKYKQSNKLVKAIQEKLNDEQKDYLQAKLGSLDHTYANYLSNQLDD